MASPDETARSQRAPARRIARDGLIGAFLLFQMAMPLRYYLGGGGADERFSWRMFSSVRMQQCHVQVRETAAGAGRTVDLGHDLQVAWVGMLERDRPDVVRKFLARRCQEPEVSRAHYERTCRNTDGSTPPPDALDMDCKTFALSPQGEAP